ncbi:MAG TPA: hypothetical protein VFT75_18315 [Nocardioidaceae bacterium]|nr:hypothetical protein [Nocardioidaceae bacterium]
MAPNLMEMVEALHSSIARALVDFLGLSQQQPGPRGTAAAAVALMGLVSAQVAPMAVMVVAQRGKLQVLVLARLRAVLLVT